MDGSTKLRSMLLAMDDSDDGHAAIALGIRWARAYGAQLTGVAFVNDAAIRGPEPVPIGGAALKDEKDREAVHEAQSRAERLLDEFREECHAAGISREEKEVVTAQPEYLSHEAHRHDVLLIGVSSNFVYGVRDVSDKILESVVKQTPRPVVAVPRGAKGEGRILVAYDGSLQAARALQSLVASGLPMGRVVTVMTVNDESEEIAHQTADVAREYLVRHNIAVETQVVPQEDGVGDAILAESNRLESGFIVMGAFGRHSLREFLFGSVTRKVLEQTTVPVFLSV